MERSGWQGVRAAIKAMLEEAGYIVRGSKGVSTTEKRYVVIVSDAETNLDRGNYVGNGQYRNERAFTLWVYNKRTEATKELDMIVQAAKDECEPILQDFKRIFGSTYNAIGDAGGINLKYTGMRFVDVPKSGIYAPVRMEANFTVQFVEDRHINQ